jgi:hypothetical protein
MRDYFLRFDSRDQAFAAIPYFTCTDMEENPEWIIANGQWALHEVGEIPGKEGWHINVRVVDPEMDTASLEPYAVNPKNPVCVWA